MDFQPGKPVQVKVEGVPGGDCRTASKPYLDALPGKVVSDKATPEMQLPPTQVGLGQKIG